MNGDKSELVLIEDLLQAGATLPLPALGEFWVKYDGATYNYLAPPFANFNPFLPIPCPF